MTNEELTLLNEALTRNVRSAVVCWYAESRTRLDFTHVEQTGNAIDGPCHAFSFTDPLGRRFHVEVTGPPYEESS